VGYKHDGNDFVYAKSDLELKEAYRLAEGRNELRLYINIQNGVDDKNEITDDKLTNSIDNYVSQLTRIVADLSIMKQNYIDTLKIQQRDLEEKKKNYTNVLESEKSKTNALSSELQRTRDLLAQSNSECATYKESLKKIAMQLQSRMIEAIDLKKDKDEKNLIEAKLQQLQKEYDTKIEENLGMSRVIHTVTIERDHYNKKAVELETRQQTFETDILNQSLQITNNFMESRHEGNILAMDYPSDLNNPFSSPSNGRPLYSTDPTMTGTSSSSLGTPLPPDINEVDIQILKSMGFKLDSGSQQQKIFDLIRQKKDISKVIEELLQ
jgi:chromosome segregation ATPase